MKVIINYEQYKAVFSHVKDNTLDIIKIKLEGEKIYFMDEYALDFDVVYYIRENKTMGENYLKLVNVLKKELLLDLGIKKMITVI